MTDRRGLSPDQAKRAVYLAALEPGQLGPMERGEMRALVRQADDRQRAAILRALALDSAARNPDSAYARGAARGAAYDPDAAGITYEPRRPDNA